MIQKNQLNILSTSRGPSKNRVILACAGSGKTWGICDDALTTDNKGKRVLMVSYTHEGVRSLKREYAKQNHGVIDKGVQICTWYQFLLRELIKPYQSIFTKGINQIRSCDFSKIYGPSFDKKDSRAYYLNNSNDVKANHASEFALHLNSLSDGAVIQRVERAYSCIYIDELQDLVGKDIDLLELLFQSETRIYCVGDYKQATLRTHNPKGGKKKGGAYVFDYLETLKESHKLSIEKENQTKRFVQDIADFANLMYGKDPIVSTANWKEEGMGVYLIMKENVDDYVRRFKPRILRYDSNTWTKGYAAMNFGVSKGMTIDRVLIFPNKPLGRFLENPINKLSAPHKYYVAATRARYSLAFVVDKFGTNSHFMDDYIDIGGQKIQVMKFAGR